MSNEIPKRAPLTGRKAEGKPGRWNSYKGANESNAGDLHFKQLSEKFWSFARTSGFASGEKTIIDVLADLWSARLHILSGAVIGIIAASVFLITAIPHTKTQMLIAPANPLNDSGGSMLDDKNFAALRFIAQRSGVNNSAGFTQFENTYSGTTVARALLANPNTADILRADNSFIFMPRQNPKEWSAEKLASYIDQNVTLEPVGASSLRRLQYWHPNPDMGKAFIQMIHAQTDSFIRAAIKAGAQERVQYLSAKMQEAVHPEHRKALTELLLEQERLLMLSSIEQPYAATIIEPPSHHYKAGWPDAKLMVPFFVLIGAFIGFIIYGVRNGRPE